MSEKSSTKSYEGLPALVLKPLEEISLAKLMANYACKVLGGNNPEDVHVAARENVMSPKWLSSRDVNVKIYSLTPHPLNIEVEVLAGGERDEYACNYENVLHRY